MAKDIRYRKLIHTARWLRLRRAVLMAHPLCEMCRAAGRVSAATEVHHVVPVETGRNMVEMEGLMFDRHNLMALCHRCHVKVHEGMGKGGKEERAKRAAGRLEDFGKRFFGGETGETG